MTLPPSLRPSLPRPPARQLAPRPIHVQELTAHALLPVQSSGEEFEVPKAASKKKAAGARKSAGSTSTPATKRKRLSAGSDKKAGGGASSAAEDGEDEVDAQAGGRPKKARTAAAGGGARGGGGGKRAKAAGALEQVTIEKDNIFFSACRRSRCSAGLVPRLPFAQLPSLDE